MQACGFHHETTVLYILGKKLLHLVCDFNPGAIFVTAVI